MHIIITSMMNKMFLTTS